MPPGLSVVVCSLNGADGVRRCLLALAGQTIAADLEVIVVDDGSADNTSEVARSGGAAVIRHPRTRGVSAARNAGIAAATAEFVAFLDDDCEPDREWAAALLAGYEASTVAAGGAVVAGPGPGLVLAFLARHNPIGPQELDLAAGNGLPYRFWLYLSRLWRPARPAGRRPVLALPSANLSVRRHALIAVGGFDEEIRFGGEDDDLCRRLSAAFPGMRLMLEPAALVVHHFDASLRDTLRRSRAYGRASAAMCCKWPDVRPTIFPFPLAVGALLAASVWRPWLAAAAVLLPQVLYPGGPRDALRSRRPASLLDPYLQLLQEASEDIGFAAGWCHFRRVFAGRFPVAARTRGPGEAR